MSSFGLSLRENIEIQGYSPSVFGNIKNHILDVEIYNAEKSIYKC